MAQVKKKAGMVEEKTAEALFTKQQLLDSRALGVPVDVLMSVLQEGERYTKDQAVGLVSDFMERKV